MSAEEPTRTVFDEIEEKLGNIPDQLLHDTRVESVMEAVLIQNTAVLNLLAAVRDMAEQLELAGIKMEILRTTAAPSSEPEASRGPRIRRI